MLAKLYPDLVSGIWAITPEAAEGYLPLLISILNGKQSGDSEIFANAREESSRIMLISQTGTAFRFTPWTEDRDIPDNSVAVIGVEGPMTKYDQFCGPVGMLTKANMLRMADANDKIKAVMLNIDSPGGEVYAAFTMADAIQKMNKPVVSFVRDVSASAAQMIASVSDEIYANSDMANIGSIGTYATIMDFRGQLEKEGIRIHEIYASASIDKNREFKEAINGNYGPMQEKVNALNDRFISIVSGGREGKLTAGKEEWGTGKMFFAERAIELGLIDGILSYEETLQTIFENLI